MIGATLLGEGARRVLRGGLRSRVRARERRAGPDEVRDRRLLKKYGSGGRCAQLVAGPSSSVSCGAAGIASKGGLVVFIHETKSFHRPVLRAPRPRGGADAVSRRCRSRRGLPSPVRRGPTADRPFSTERSDALDSGGAESYAWSIGVCGCGKVGPGRGFSGPVEEVSEKCAIYLRGTPQHAAIRPSRPRRVGAGRGQRPPSTSSPSRIVYE